MATKLFKNGKAMFFPTDQVAKNLEAGWTTEKVTKPVKPVAKKTAAKAKD